MMETDETAVGEVLAMLVNVMRVASFSPPTDEKCALVEDATALIGRYTRPARCG